MTAAFGSRTSSRRRNAIVGSLVVVAMFAWGTSFYGLGFYLLRLNDIRGWSLSAISNIILLFYLAAVVISFWVSAQLARRGPRVVIFSGAAAIGAALVALPHVTNLWMLAAVFLLLSAGWSATNSNPISTTIMAWFPTGQRELATALIGASFGGILLIPALGWADDRYSFTAAVTGLGIATFVVVGGLAVLVVEAPDDGMASSSTAQRADRMAWSIMGGQRFWLLASALALAIIVQGGFLVHQLSILGTVVSDAKAAQIVGLATAAALAGRLGPIVVGDRVPPAVVGSCYLAVQALALFVLALADHTPATLTLMSMLYGLGVGVLITMPSLLTRSTYPDLPYTSAYPVVNLSFQLPLAAGAPILALLHDRFDGYPSAIWALALADAGAAVLLLVNHRQTSAPSAGSQP